MMKKTKAMMKSRIKIGSTPKTEQAAKNSPNSIQ